MPRKQILRVINNRLTIKATNGGNLEYVFASWIIALDRLEPVSKYLFIVNNKCHTGTISNVYYY